MKIIKLLVSITIPLLAGFIGSSYTTPFIASWYANINKSPLNPPNWIFAPVWTTLFILMGISLFLVWQKKHQAQKTYFILFGVQLVLNVLWSALFFALQAPFWALLEMILLIIAIASLMMVASRISKPAMWLLLPYLLWVSFATFLTFSVWQLNK